MIEKGSKGKMFNFENMFKEIGKVTINKKEINKMKIIKKKRKSM